MIAKAYDLACQKEMERRRHRSKEETENSELLRNNPWFFELLMVL